MALPSIPATPTYPIPLWAAGTVTPSPGPLPPPVNSADPGSSQRSSGWTPMAGQNYGQIPPYPWENYMKYITGVWLYYEKNLNVYLQQVGVMPWQATLIDAVSKYQIGSIVQDGAGKIYRSRIDNNSSALSVTASWGSPKFPSGMTVLDLVNGDVSLNVSNLSTASTSDSASLNLISPNSVTPTSPATFQLKNTGTGTSTLSMNDPASIFQVVMPFGQMMQMNGSTGVTNFSGALTYAGRRVFTRVVIQKKVAGDTVYTPTAGMVYCIVEAVAGGGGGGGAAPGPSTSSVGGGGGSGMYVRDVYDAATIGPSVAITIGTRGIGGPGTNGGSGSPGGNTIFGSFFTAFGGGGGTCFSGPVASSLIAPGGVGGTTLSPTGLISIRGSAGTIGVATNQNGNGGNGAPSFFAGACNGGFAPASGTSAVGATGFLFGGGGGGAVQIATASTLVGSDGESGVIIITEFLL